jgi:hypothetical protein
MWTGRLRGSTLEWHAGIRARRRSSQTLRSHDRHFVKVAHLPKTWQESWSFCLDRGAGGV